MASTPPAAPRVKVVQPGEGRTGGLVPGVGVIFKIDGDDTGSAISIVEHPFAVGALVPPHIHTREDELSYVLEGEIGFRSNDQQVVLSAGGYIVKPRGELHAMWNAGSTPARMIEVIAPSGFERFFAGLVDLTDAGPPDPQAVADLSDRYGLLDPEQDPDWLAEIIDRYGLTPPPGR
jgi:quercetin dioxygenase-like cupin family protein